MVFNLVILMHFNFNTDTLYFLVCMYYTSPQREESLDHFSVLL